MDVQNFRESHAGVQGAPTASEFESRIRIWEEINETIFSENSYGNIKSILNLFGVVPASKDGYASKFGLMLDARKPLVIEPAASMNLFLADGLGVGLNNFEDKSKKLISFGDEETEMLIFDGYMSLDNAHYYNNNISAEVRESFQSSTVGAQKMDDIVGVCVVSPAHESIKKRVGFLSDGKWLIPQAAAGSILFPDAKFDIDLQLAIEAASVVVAKKPEHGSVYVGSSWDIKYMPNEGFLGNDRIEFDVVINENKIRVIYFIHVVGGDFSRDSDFLRMQEKYCPEEQWRIASFNQPPLLDPATAPITFTLADLPGQSLGLTSGTSITLDTNGAGHGWYFDPPPVSRTPG